MSIRRINISILFFYFLVTSGYSQSYFSPFSYQGIGEISPSDFVKQKGLATSIAVTDSNSHSVNNPATYSNLRSFAFETAVSSSFYNWRGLNQTYSNMNVGIPYISIGFPILSKIGWGVGAGLLPYSNVGYRIKSTVEGDIPNTQTFKGQGGLSRFYFGTSFTLFRKLSIGANASYIFGHTDLIHTLKLSDESVNFSLYSNTSLHVDGFIFDAGATIPFFFGNGKSLQVGLKADLPRNVGVRQVYDAYTTGIIPRNYSDSLVHNQTIAGSVSFPLGYGGAVQFRSGQKFLLNAEYYTRNWSSFKIAKTDGNVIQPTNFANSFSYAIGGQLMPDPKGSKYGDRIQYRIGLRYTKSYFTQNVNSVWSSPVDKKLSLGIGFPVYRKDLPKRFKEKPEINSSSVDVSLELGQLGKNSTTTFADKYAILSVGFHIFDFDWFFRRKID